MAIPACAAKRLSEFIDNDGTKIHYNLEVPRRGK
jgi:hypothetical protein